MRPYPARHERQISGGLIRNDSGFTLVELIVVMAIFIVIIMVTSGTFENIIKRAGVESKTGVSQMEGIVGLEVLRYDLEHAGYGLPWQFQNTPNAYAESTVVDESLAPGISSQAFNDVPPTVPHAVLFGPSTKEAAGKDSVANTGVPGPDYLVVKSAMAAMTPVSRKWSYVNYSTNAAGQNLSYMKKWGGADAYANGDNVITISSSFTTQGTPGRQLVMNGQTFSYAVAGSNPPTAFMPGDGTQMYITYGIDTTTLRMPYNRADFYVRRPAATAIPQSCNPGTGILYKGIVRHNDGSMKELPLLNCVGDMQVVLDVDPSKSGSISSNSAFLYPATMDAGSLRDQLKNVRVYILAHEGGLDRSYTYPSPDPAKVIVVGSGVTGRTWTKDAMQKVFGNDWMHYRWKVYSIVVHPDSLN